MSNKFFTLCGCLLLSISVSKAQDTLVLNDGTLIKSKVVEITESLLKYKKYSNLDGPVYTIDKKQVLAVHYENGEQESFKAQEQQTVQTQSEEQTTQKEIEVPVADNNAALIEYYNRPVQLCKNKLSNKPAKWGFCKFGMTEESVLSNSDVEISITVTERHILSYGIEVKNKTDKNIYIDLGNCFAVEDSGYFRSFYDGTTQKSVNNGTVNGGTINLGSVTSALGVGGTVGTLANGITLGGGSQNSLTTTYINERFLTIPPHGVSYVSVYKAAQIKQGGPFSSAKFETLTLGEWFNSVPVSCFKRGLVQKGGVNTYNENNSPYKRDYIITYSDDPNFSSYSKVKFTVFLHQIIGTYVSFIYRGKTRTIYEALSEVISNYTYGMIVSDNNYMFKK